MRSRTAQVERLKHERRHVDIAGAAAIADLLALHESVGGIAPGRVGFGLLLRHAAEVGRAVGILCVGDERAEPADEENRERRGGAAQGCRHPLILHRTGRHSLLVRSGQPLAQVPGRVRRRRSVERHQRGGHAGDPDDIGAPAILSDRRDLDQIRAPADRFLKPM